MEGEEGRREREKEGRRKGDIGREKIRWNGKRKTSEKWGGKNEIKYRRENEKNTKTNYGKKMINKHDVR